MGCRQPLGWTRATKTVRGRLPHQYVPAPCLASLAACGFPLLEAACGVACRQQPQVGGRQCSGNAEGNAHSFLLHPENSSSNSSSTAPKREKRLSRQRWRCCLQATRKAALRGDPKATHVACRQLRATGSRRQLTMQTQAAHSARRRAALAVVYRSVIYLLVFATLGGSPALRLTKAKTVRLAGAPFSTRGAAQSRNSVGTDSMQCQRRFSG